MALNLLLPLLASLWMLPRTASPAGPLPAPQLTVFPQQPVYVMGEAVTLTCSADRASTVPRIQFYRNGQKIHSKELSPLPNRYRSSIQVSGVSGLQAEEYTCDYWETESGLEISSERSRPISIAVTAPLPAPQLTVSPQQTVYVTGETVTLTCSANRASALSGIRFFRHSQKVHSKELPSHRYSYTESIRLSEVSRSQAGTYTCESWKTVSGREIPSERSRLISIAVTAPLPAPQLAVSPQQPVYVTGETVTLTCSANRASALSGIRFFRHSQKVHSKELPSHRYSYTESIRLSEVSRSQAGTYTCESWKTVSGREIPSERSRLISIAVTAPLPAPQLTVSPQQPVYVTGETVTLTCSANRASALSGIRFFRHSQKVHSKELPSHRYSYTESIRLSEVSRSQAGTYTCESWKTVSGREIPSERSRLISIAVTDRPPQPSLSMDPPSGVVSEGFPLLITCMAPRDADQRRFHFYKDSVKLIPGDAGSEISTTEPSTSSMNISVLSIPKAGPNSTGEFTCGYEENVGGRWIPSPRSHALNVTVTVPKPLKSTKGSEPGEHTRNRRDNKGSKATCPGAEQMEQGSEVIYALMVFPASQAHATQTAKNPKPAEDEHVLYSEVVTTHTWKATK
ncbi:immunoglobulin superfamily member 1-like isoform X2 [Dermochelys coriacea]|uniref:immunoglobulin superfamily member 1-like isoform X2 n=1 Tax=Dermochelys coriacea TaxID=27794 RepID=UPI001CA9AD14|nr:immunoglobulin superfamily member 1-like isoform X2 [Dermochelys coriacea]